MFKGFVVLSATLVMSVFAAKSEDDDVKAQEIVYEKPTEWRVYAANSQVESFTLQKDLLWYATADMVYSSNLKRSEIQKFSALGKIPGAGITSIAADPSGAVWFAGPNGIAVKTGTQFTNYTAENGLPDNDVKDLLVAPDGKIWIATAKGAASYSAGAWKKYTTTDGLVSDDVRVLAADTKGGIWFGTNKGISVLTGTSWTTWDMKKGMSWNNVKAMAWDKRKNIMWAAVGEKDINSFENGAWKVYMDIQPDVTSIMIDSQSRIWFGSPTGLVKFNGDDWIYDPKQHGVPVNVISEMLKDDGGNMWFGMEKGVLRMANPYPF